MSEIIEDFDPNTGKSSSSNNEGTKKKHSYKKRKFTPMIIHIGFLLLLMIIIIFFFFLDFSLFSGDEKNPILEVIGKQENFTLPYKGDIVLEASRFNLLTNSGNFDGKDEKLEIANFNGVIEKQNSALIFKGNGTNISFGNNVLRLDRDTSFRLNSSKKTTLQLFIDSLSMNFSSGVIKFDDKLSYDFNNASVMMSNGNTTLTYDGTFSFTSFVEEFRVTSNSLEISYVQNSTMN